MPARRESARKPCSCIARVPCSPIERIASARKPCSLNRVDFSLAETATFAPTLVTFNSSIVFPVAALILAFWASVNSIFTSFAIACSPPFL